MSDLIERQAAIDALLHNQEIYSNNFGTDAIDKYTIAIIDNDVQTIAQLPSAKKVGKWIDGCSCSICHWIHEDSEGFALLTNYPFCPSCGAKMEEAEK